MRRAFVEQALSGAALDRLWAHLGSCAACRDRYERLVRLERLSESGGASAREPCRGELSLLQARVLRASAPRPEPTRAGLLARPGLLAAAGSVAALLVVVGVGLRLPIPRDSALQARAGDRGGFAARAFCRLPGNGEAGAQLRSLSQDPSPQELARCPRGSSVVFAYRAEEEGMLQAFARLADGTVRDLAPGGPVRLAAAARLAPLALDLGPADRGDLEVVLVFSPRAVEARQIEQALSGALDEKRLQGELDAAVVVLPIRFDPASPGSKGREELR